MIDEIFEVGRALRDKLREKNITRETAREQIKQEYEEKIRPNIHKYAVTLLLTALAIVFVPMVFILPGILLESKTLIIIGGSLRVLFTVFLAFLIAPVALMLEIVLRGRSGSGERYTRFVIGLCMSELFFTLLVCFVPLKNNPDMIAPFILGAAILGFLNAWFFQPKYIAGTTAVLFVGMLISFFMPHTQEKSVSLLKGCDREIAGPKLVSKSCSQFKSEGIRWSADGSYKYWYHIGKEGEFRVYDGQGRDIVSGNNLQPFNEGILQIYCRQTDWSTKTSPSYPGQGGHYDTENKGRGSIAPPSPDSARPITPGLPLTPKANPYIADTGFLNSASSQEMAVVVVNERGRHDSAASGLVAGLLRSGNNKVSDSLFRSSFVTAGIFDRFYSGKIRPTGDLDFTGSTDYLVLGKVFHHRDYDSFFKKNSLKTVIEVRIISASTGGIIKSFSGEGLSFDEDEGRARQFAASVATEDLREQMRGGII